MVKRETRKLSYAHANANANACAVLFMLMLPFLLTQRVHAEIALGGDAFYDAFDATLDERFEIEFDGSISELVPGIDFIVAAQEQSGKIATSQVRALEEDEDLENIDNVDIIGDDAVVQILFNENFAKCNNETMHFYRENPFINKAVREFGDSATATWSGPNSLNLNLDFNETMKDRMKDACKNNPDESLDITTSGEQGKYAFAGDLNCTYKIQGGETANTSITNYANCVADTEACNAVDETDFLRIVMHSLGSACSGLEREGTLRCVALRCVVIRCVSIRFFWIFQLCQQLANSKFSLNRHMGLTCFLLHSLDEIVRYSGGTGINNLAFGHWATWTAIAIGTSLSILMRS